MACPVGGYYEHYWFLDKRTYPVYYHSSTGNKPKLPKRTKTTHIPQKEYYDPETGEIKYYSYDDEITNTTIEDVLNGR